MTDSSILARDASYTMECHSKVDSEGYCVGCRTYHGQLDKPGPEGCYFYRLAFEVYRKHAASLSHQGAHHVHTLHTRPA
ncbi:hypothetical protein [Stackebrandtia nassauensis]|uniref:Uncharacterized protein n=1 Tax=Stackebrandtia nassauensis (strain DSM 44728 / CIP 108903 / NRRL B-16338 / NBRC 102104 / LLR-40K-21) TaxID=446470 RepID=D3QBX9_STANL|nr:hypothetical protein [Stackebrandtia nassauensis]ADD44868.1 hypothetical protein Snas_5234 [Stackebrandtia nassauensis DSM 44728]